MHKAKRFLQVPFAILLSNILSSGLVFADDLSNAMTELNTVIIPKQKKTLWCTSTMNRISREYLELKKGLMDYRYNDYTDALSRFEVLKSSHIKYFSTIEKFIQETLTELDTLTTQELSDRISDLTHHKGTVIKKLSAIETEEDELLATLNIYVKKFNNFLKQKENQLSTVLSHDCEESGVRTFYASIEADLKKSVRILTDMQSFITAGKRKRADLLSIAFGSLQIILEAKYENVTYDMLVNLHSQISTVLMVGELGERFYKWDVYIAGRGYGDRLGLLYYQYERPLRLMRTRLQKAKGYEAELLAIPNRPVQSDIVLNAIRRTITDIQNTIDNLIKTGWKGQLDKQIDSIHRRQEMPDVYSSACLEVFSDLLTQTGKVRTIDEFRTVEARYLELSRTCDHNPDSAAEDIP